MTHEKGTRVPSHMLCLNIEHYVLLGTGHIRKDLSLPTVHCKRLEIIGKEIQEADLVTEVLCALGTWAGST